MKKSLALLLVLTLMLAVVAGCASTGKAGASDEKVIKIGVFEPVTGENGGGGFQEVLGMRYANTKVPTVDLGGVSYKIELVEVDNKSEDICCKGWMSNPLLKQRRLAHSQRFEPATQRGRDRQAAWSERYVHPYISSSKIELAAALTRKDVSPLPPTTPVGGARTA